ncbi:baseplate J/gp47 family protein [Marinibactrum halimedae]|uniref:Baseplate protein J-like domain-containing protein n=1 Tax=Marinibactrum halimedae TaxID=1444977 RepID=A0AA37WPV7_9GAMM|nr:baseplate J/gp47 family protein [Marinibactrum halimedae]MCD9460779.1 baseplate J/gp47 family protein [Marinibactrum halimedae]GLS27366.1 hypothetical protein GCM10007877_30850 [Marinibactrum halimedae]
MSAFTQIDLSELPPPNILEALDYDTILAATKTELKAIAPDIDVDALLPSDPITKLLEIMAYREMHLLHRINESAQGVMLAKATGANLDNLAALLNIQRLILEPGEPSAGIEPVFESDERLRERTQLAFEGFSTAGPVGAYVFHALSASAQVKDVVVYSDFPGEVEVRILSTEEDGKASPELLTKVSDALNDDNVRPITDLVSVNSADIVPYTINATLVLAEGVGAQEVLELARAATKAYIEKSHKLGFDITRAALFSILHQPGVKNVQLHQPTTDILIKRHQAPSGSILSIDSSANATAAPTDLAEGVSFTNQSTAAGKLKGVVTIEPALDETDITHYALYWGGNNAEKLPLGAKLYTVVNEQLTLDHSGAINIVMVSLDGKTFYVEGDDYEMDGQQINVFNKSLEGKAVRVSYDLPAIAELSKSLSSLEHDFSTRINVPTGATHFLVFTKNEFGEMLYGQSVEI